ncbi:biliverdin-producing heme oxygenase [Pseudarthrobacter raffinosi]|uniref:biliverdin-producing heme oxygenase n=1 Tax=Pseudarthrobacter raffinosi TaxID=2953651 RepID=UPI00208ED16A|nr:MULTISPECIES: biliverdin-producing heme oxygenase [unclassified Pseudarthrobacter]MCO4237128.1 biliverdin-producing heme oxygenase [Pseudarthrobacter sp. MDT3-28]MCO4251480.1 biliverdin-producing heme oxygenase [Pseudarthrobacter sp. MDT3-9]MCO4261966.1 biliverdin-producing heme oxygenase [Pseudarthrobacter sp. MDT3-26]
MTAPLSVLLTQSTSAAHEEAESSPFMGDLLKGRMDAAAVAALTAQLDKDGTEEVLAHAAHAFRLNGGIFADLQLAVGARPQPAA